MKLENSLKLHSIENNEENNFYIIFIDMTQPEVDQILDQIKGNEISSINYSKFVNEEKLVQSFQIKQEELDNSEEGILRAVYNRISVKELK